MITPRLISFLVGIFTIFLTLTMTAEGSTVKLQEAKNLADDVYYYFYMLFVNCIRTSMPDEQYIVDNLRSYVNYPSKTTVGFAPKYTSNRKFFANMISNTEFKAMLEKDIEILRKNMIKKFKFCDTAVMDQELLKDMYDREVDPTKL